MKWYTTWWCVLLSPETDEDKALLDALTRVLPREADACYESGIWEWKDEYYEVIDPVEVEAALVSGLVLFR